MKCIPFVICILSQVWLIAVAAPTLSPTVGPSFAPTPIPASVTQLPLSADPIAKHQLVVVPAGGNHVIQLTFYDPATTRQQFQIVSTPETGTLYQLSQVFSNYGYEPKAGTKIFNATSAAVTGSKNRVYYSRPSPDTAGVNKWGSFDFKVVRQTDSIPSYVSTVTLVPPSGNIVGSNFLLSDEGWTVTGNKAQSSRPSHERYTRGALLSFYISGTDDVINVDSSTSPDQSLWYFEAPKTYYGNQGIAYGGSLSFTIAAFSGDFSSLNDKSTNIVELECESCDGPIRKGIRLGFSMAALMKSPGGMFNGDAKRISIPLNEFSGWLKDSQDVLVPWYKVSQCDIIQVLSRLSKIRILGDYTTWYETVAIDNVQISNTKGSLPLCAMETPDASICTCA